MFGHGWVFFKGERMSKTMGNIVDPLDAAERFGPDPLRLYLTKEVPYGGDGDFTWERFEEKYNADLANNLGNLVNRVASMTERYRQGTLTRAGGDPDRPVRRGRGRARRLPRGDGPARPARGDGRRVPAGERDQRVRRRRSSRGRWPRTRRRTQQLTDVLYDAAEAVRIAAVLLLPVMPASAAEILRRMGDQRAGRRAAPRPTPTGGRARPSRSSTPGRCGPASKTRERLS